MPRESLAISVDRFLSSPSGDFSRTSSPSFSLLGIFSLRSQGLAGDDFVESRTRQMPAMWESKTLHGWVSVYCFGRVAALPVSRLWLSVFPLVEIYIDFPSSFFDDSLEFFEERSF
jgi:hypothetical protein